MTNEEQHRESSRLWTADYLRVFFSNLLLMMINFIIPSIFTLFLLSRGGNDLQAGISASLYSGVSFVVRPLSGWLLDHRGRKCIVVVCLALLILTPWFYLGTGIVVLLIVNRTVSGILSSAASTGLTTSAYDCLPADRFNQGVGYFGFSNALANAIGPVIGLKLYHVYGPAAVFGLLSAAAAVGFLLMLQFHYRPLPPESRTALRDEKLKELLFEADALPASVLDAVPAVTSGAISTYLAAYMLQRGDLVNAGTFFSFQAAGTFISRFFVGKISDRRGEAPLVYASTALLCAGLAGVIFANTPYIVYPCASMMGVAYGFTVTGLQIMSVRIVRQERRGAAASTYACLWDVGAAAGGLIAGILASHFSYRIMFGILWFMYPLYLLLYLIWGRKHASAFRNCAGN